MSQPLWVTPAGNFGTYTEGSPINVTFTATPSTVGYTLEYTMLNGTFPEATVAFQLNSATGTLTGTPSEVSSTQSYSFTIRVFQYNGATLEGLADRTFSFTVEGVTPPTFLTPAGPLYDPPNYLPDSTWDPYQILIDNPDPGNTTIIRLISGSLPPGLEMNESGLIRGYAEIVNGVFPFTLAVDSESGSSTRSFSIQVYQQLLADRKPAILNTRPPKFVPDPADTNAPYYINESGNIGTLSQDNYFIFKIIGESFNAGPISYSRTGTLPPGVTDNINYTSSNTVFTISNGGSGYVIGDELKIMGSLLDGTDIVNDLSFTVAAVDGAGAITEITSVSGWNVDSADFFPLLPVTTVTGVGVDATISLAKTSASWIFGTIDVDPELLIETYNFAYTAVNTNNNQSSDPINFSVVVVSQIDNVPFDPTLEWVTSPDLGTISNGAISSLYVRAISLGGVDLTYSVTSGSLPPELELSDSGEIVGRVSFETQSTVVPKGTTIPYTFTVTAQNLTYPELTTDRTFTVTVVQQFDEPYDNIYIKAYFDIESRMKLNSLLQDVDIIPWEYLYRPYDIYFGKANSVIYQHMYGVPSSTVDTYITAVQKNHYRRNLILGPVKTAVARDSNGDILYEIVYSEIIDDLVNNEGVSISKEIVWPWPINGVKPTLYPNSLPNMREQIVTFIGQETQSSILPPWMITQQENGDILGFIPVWIICYTKPGYSKIIKNNIVSPFTGDVLVTKSYAYNNTYECRSTADMYVGMKIKFSGEVFGGVTAGVQYYVYSIESPRLFTVTTSMVTQPLDLSDGEGEMYFEHVTWAYTLNYFDFRLDRFEVSKALTFDYDPLTSTWTTLPSGVDPTDNNDQYIHFKKNILSGT